MPSCVAAIAFGLFVWWFSTGLALWIVGSAGRAPRIVAGGTVATFVLALAALAFTKADTSQTGIYGAFTAAILVWGTQEVAFLSGWITGPRRTPCPAGARGLTRMWFAIEAILYHELALAASGLLIGALTWGGTNRVGIATFGVLLAMRVSAKFNLFLGVPNITDSFMPAGLDHLKSFFARRAMNALFPVSVTACTVALVLLVLEVSRTDGPATSALTLIATLVGLGLVEHWFLVLPLPVEALWSWSTGKIDAATPVPSASAPASAIVTSEAAPPRRTATIVKLEPRTAPQPPRATPQVQLQGHVFQRPFATVQGAPAGSDIIGRKTP